MDVNQVNTFLFVCVLVYLCVCVCACVGTVEPAYMQLCIHVYIWRTEDNFSCHSLVDPHLVYKTGLLIGLAIIN